MTTKILSGNELIVKGGLEAGLSLYTGYPGSPLADYFNILFDKKDELEKLGVKAVLANSEANAAAMASGAKQAGKDVMVAMKSMGLHVAADALSVGNFADPGPKFNDDKTKQTLSPAVVIVVGDDPWSMSTSTPADSRYLFKHLHIPFLEPSTPQELKDWIKSAKEISAHSSIYQGLILSTFMAEGGGLVEVFENKQLSTRLIELDTSTFDLSKNVMVPPNSMRADIAMIKERFPKVLKTIDALALDKQFGRDDASIGFISSGAIFETLKEIWNEHNYADEFSLYKLASSYPLGGAGLLSYLNQLDHLIVVEEKRGFLETELKELIQSLHLNITVWGKEFMIDKVKQEGFPAYAGLTYEIIQSKIHQILCQLNIDAFKLHQQEAPAAFPLQIPARLPTFCPGCPHRETLSLLKDLRGKLASEGIDLISHGDVGCYSLSFLPPFKEMHNLSAMGQGGALGAGVDLFTTNPSVVLMGDSTFFHSGITDISNSVQMGHNITYILLDNGNTAMTGHQMTPRTGVSVDGGVRPKQDIEKIINGLGVNEVLNINPSDRYFYQNVLMSTVKASGVKVIISNKECGLTFHGRRKSIERKMFQQNKPKAVQNFYQINTSACEDCRECIEMTGCPGLTKMEDAYGSKMSIDAQICVGDSYCTKLKACPSFELVKVLDYHPSLYQVQTELDVEKMQSEIELPEMKYDFEHIVKHGVLRIVVTGVGGSGVTTISKVLSQAAQVMEDELDYKFMDQKGLAQRNGNVTSHITLFKKGLSVSAVTPSGRADLLLSPDLMDAARQWSFLNEKGYAIIDKTFQVPVSMLLDNEEQKAQISQTELLQTFENLAAARVEICSFKDIAYQKLGKSVYSSAMILGTAFQKGYLPFSLDSLKHAFKVSIPAAEFENNWKSFMLGRELAVMDKNETATVALKVTATAKDYTDSIKASMPFWQDSKFLLKFYDSDLKRLLHYLPTINVSYLQQYLHDIYIYNRGAISEEFINNAALLPELYTDHEQLKISLRTLARTYWIKDEIFVSHLMISPMSTNKDKITYAKLGKSYKKIFINRPQFDIFNRKIEFDISPRVWMLSIMRHMRWARWMMPKWHKKEKNIAAEIRNRIVNVVPKIKDKDTRWTALKKLENIKGYRQVRYAKAAFLFEDSNNKQMNLTGNKKTLHLME